MEPGAENSEIGLSSILKKERRQNETILKEAFASILRSLARMEIINSKSKEIPNNSSVWRDYRRRRLHRWKSKNYTALQKVVQITVHSIRRAK